MSKKKKKRRSQLPRIGKEFISDPSERHPDKIEQRTLTPQELAQLWVRRDTINLEAVEQYIYMLESATPPPITILRTTLNGKSIDIIWNGHHRAVAAYLTDTPIPAIIMHKEHHQLAFKLARRILVPIQYVQLNTIHRWNR